MSDDTPSILDIDWRYCAATTLAEDWVSPYSGVLHRKGTPVTASTFVKHGKRRLRIGDPSAPALFLSQSQKAYEQALQIHPFVLEDWPPVSGVDPSVVAYDCLELIMASVIFAYTALEAFANEEIPEDFAYEQQTESGLYVVRDKEWVERNLTLDDKLATILPKVTGKPSPKGLKLWKDYVHLRKLRHRIVHLKSSDRARSKGNNLYPDSIWSKLLDPQQLNYPLVAKEMVVHFRGKDSVHWLRYCPF
jgi:hypothetical protein